MQYYNAKDKDAIMQIRLPISLREDFKRLCQQHNIVASAVVRQLIIDWIAAQQDTTITHKRSSDI
jgi:hypothetical protein